MGKENAHCNVTHQGVAFFSHLHLPRGKCFDPVLVHFEVPVGCRYLVPQLFACRELGWGLVYSPQRCVEIQKYGEGCSVSVSVPPTPAVSRMILFTVLTATSARPFDCG